VKKKLSAIFQVMILPLPWVIRRVLLNCIPDVKLSASSRIGFSIVLAKNIVLDEGAVITHLTFVNDVDRLHMKAHSKIGKSNWITGANSSARMFSDVERKCELVLGEHARITSKHHIDCTAGVYIGAFTTIAGLGTRILTHSIDIQSSRQTCNPVCIGEYCFVGTDAILLMGSSLPDCCVLGAGSVLNKEFSDPRRSNAASADWHLQFALPTPLHIAEYNGE